jgi:hypothetical protein
MPVWLELRLTRKQEEYRYLGAARRRRQMSSSNGSIANLLVTRKSLVSRNLEVRFLFRFPVLENTAAGRRREIKKPAPKGAGIVSRDFFPPNLAARGSLDNYFWMLA